MNGTEEVEWIGSPARLREAVERAWAIRDACGPDFGIAIDFHGRVHKGTTKQLVKELEPVKPLFIEEPVLAENNEALLDLRRTCSTPIATGERQFTRWGFKQLLSSGGADIVQPDVSHCGGISELKKIATMAEGQGATCDWKEGRAFHFGSASCETRYPRRCWPAFTALRLQRCAAVQSIFTLFFSQISAAMTTFFSHCLARPPTLRRSGPLAPSLPWERHASALETETACYLYNVPCLPSLSPLAPCPFSSPLTRPVT